MERLAKARLITAIKTPYLPNGEIDLETFDRLVEKQIEGGVEGLVIGGTTGEGHLMSWDEHIMLIAHSVHYHGGQIAIIGNTGSNNTREAIHATKQGFAVGMDAALQINPYYGKTSTAGLKAHFQRVFDIGPAIVYNVPSRTGQDIQPSLMTELAKHAHFLGVKECQGPERIGEYTSQGIRCWSGNDDDSSDSRHHYGANGVISVAANVVPRLMRQLMDSEQPELKSKLKPLMTWLFSEPNPIALNTVLAMTGAVKPIFRLPYAPLDKEGREEGMALLEEIDRSFIVGDQLNLLDNSDFLLI